MSDVKRAFFVIGVTVSVMGLQVGCERAAPPAPGASSKPSGQGVNAQNAKEPGYEQAKEPVKESGNAAPVAPPQQPPAKEDVADLASPTFILGGMKFTKPEGWTRSAPSNPMRKAEFRIPAPSGVTTDDCVVAFSQAGGAVQWNLDRWKTQVTGPDNKPAEATITVQDVAGVKVHVFTSSGNYQDGMPGGPKTPREQWVLRAAVIETTPVLTFAKMVGPAAAMNEAKPAWDAMIAGLVKVE